MRVRLGETQLDRSRDFSWWQWCHYYYWRCKPELESLDWSSSSRLSKQNIEFSKLTWSWLAKQKDSERLSWSLNICSEYAITIWDNVWRERQSFQRPNRPCKCGPTNTSSAVPSRGPTSSAEPRRPCKRTIVTLVTIELWLVRWPAIWALGGRNGWSVCGAVLCHPLPKCSHFVPS